MPTKAPSGMKQEELRRHARCTNCNKLIGQTSLPLFFKITIERHGIDLGAVKRQTGLEMMLGSPFIAAAMGPNEDMTRLLAGPFTATICEDCACKDISLHHISEQAHEKQAAAEPLPDRQS